MKALVTGAAGFIGSSICDRLLLAGYEVVGVDCFLDYYPRKIKENNLREARAHSNFTFLEEDLLAINLFNLLADVDLVFHQAAQAGVRASWGKYFTTYVDNNITLTQALLEAAKLSSAQPAARLKKMIYASSSSVYGNAETLPTSETITPAPVSPYGVTKLAAEHMMSLYAVEHGLESVSLRYFTVYGPRQRPDMAFHRFIRCGLSGEELSLFGDGEQSRDFTFIDDIVSANLAAAERGRRGAVYNLGGGSVVTVNQVLSIIENVIGKKLKVKRSERQLGDARHTSANTELAQKELGFRPQTSLEQGIAREVAWVEEMLLAGIL